MNKRASNAETTALFRAEALDARRPKQYGDIILLPGKSSRLTAMAALALVLCVAAFLVWGSYTRRSTVSGQLYPSEGLIRVTANQPGVVIERRAVDGQVVRRGDVLFVLSTDRAGPDAVDYQRGMSAQIEARRISLEADLSRIRGAADHESAQLQRRVASLRSEMDQVVRQGVLQGQRAKGAEDAVARYQDLYRQGFASRDELLTKESELAEARGRVEAQRRDALALERERGTALRDIEALHARHANQRAELERAVLVTRQEFTELEARRRVVLAAPADGRLTLVQAEVGQSVEAMRPLLHLVPTDSRLIARLYVPSRAAGFTRPGTTALLRYDAFPFQKFGQQVGQVLSVSTAAVASSELQGLSRRPELAGEPMFAISVSLPEQTMGGAARRLPLQSGMQVEADLMHETRPLYEWILEPLYAARARLHDG